jgi:hypothetical protein
MQEVGPSSDLKILFSLFIFLHCCIIVGSFSDISVTMDNNVYLGVWTNWSNGKVLGATLTTTRRDGNLLIALTGFLVPFVASRFWSIFCLVAHQYFSTSDSRDALHHQRQVILRNSSSPDSGLVSLFRLLWAWRSSRLSEKTKKYYSRLLPVILFAICCISAFTVAGAFSSQISSSPGEEVLVGSNLPLLVLYPSSRNSRRLYTRPMFSKKKTPSNRLISSWAGRVRVRSYTNLSIDNWDPVWYQLCS